MNGKRKQGRNKRRERLIYAASILALTALVGVAFFSPGWVFRFQDKKQCSDTVLEERENVDVAVLGTNYEPSFYQRMVNFAEDQSENTNYYLASEELTDYDKLRDFLNSENGFNRESIWTLLEAGLITERIYECEVSAWKQYVIYSDDYAKGVNFILWYIELEHPDNEIGTYKLLLEADTGDFYALQADTGGSLGPENEINKKYVGYEYSLADYLYNASTSTLNNAWMLMAYFYSGLAGTDFFEFYDQYYGAAYAIFGQEYMENHFSQSIIVNGGMQKELEEKLGAANSDWMEFLKVYPELHVLDSGNRLDGVFPYGKGSMVFRLQMEESVPYPWTLHHITIGFPAIYSLIPEFGQ